MSEETSGVGGLWTITMQHLAHGRPITGNPITAHSPKQRWPSNWYTIKRSLCTMFPSIDVSINWLFENHSKQELVWSIVSRLWLSVVVVFCIIRFYKLLLPIKNNLNMYNILGSDNVWYKSLISYFHLICLVWNFCSYDPQMWISGEVNFSCGE